MTSILDFGAQGGDPSRGVSMDLSTCVNRYGPAPAVVAALHAIEPQDILLHPYDAADRLKDVYVWATGVEADDLVAGRGASEFIWAMGREVDHATAAIPMPAYTDYLKAFPGRGFSRNREQMPSLEQVDAALTAGALVIVSNPHNPTGALLDRDGLITLAADHPDSTLVVDESYINFTPDPAGRDARKGARPRPPGQHKRALPVRVLRAGAHLRRGHAQPRHRRARVEPGARRDTRRAADRRTAGR
jgi:histidinol-phosphate aminotransferase